MIQMIQMVLLLPGNVVQAARQLPPRLAYIHVPTHHVPQADSPGLADEDLMSVLLLHGGVDHDLRLTIYDHMEVSEGVRMHMGSG